MLNRNQYLRLRDIIRLNVFMLLSLGFAASATAAEYGRLPTAPGTSQTKQLVITLTSSGKKDVILPIEVAQPRVVMIPTRGVDPAKPITAPGISVQSGKSTRGGWHYQFITQNARPGNYQLFGNVNNRWQLIPLSVSQVVVSAASAVCPASTDPNVPIPRVTSWGPQPAGSIDGSLTLNGTNFRHPGLCVKLGTEYLEVLSGSANQITARLPKTRRSGPLVVSHGTASSEYVLYDNYRVIGPPSITRISPTTIKFGDIVTIEGSDLDSLYPAPLPNVARTEGLVKISSTASAVGTDFLRASEWAWSPDATRVTFRAQDIYISDTASGVGYRTANPQPTQLTGPLRLLKPGTNQFEIVAGTVTWMPAPLAVTRVRPPAWGDVIPSFVIVPSHPPGNPPVSVDIEGSGLWAAEASMGGQRVTSSFSYHGTNGFVRPSISTPSDFVTVAKGGVTVRSPSVLQVIPGPEVIPPSNIPRSSGAWGLKLDQEHTFQGWNLQPAGTAGLNYQFTITKLNANFETACRIKLTMIEHTTNHIKLRIGRTGDVPEGCLRDTVFSSSGSTYNVMQLNATFNGVTRELWRQTYYLIL